MYDLDLDSIDDILRRLADNAQRRRLEKNISRKMLAQFSGVAVSVIVKFERQHKISLEAYVRIAKALGYTDDIKSLLSEPKYSTMEELEMINSNKNRIRAGHYEADK